MPGLCRLNYRTFTETPSLGLGVFFAVVAIDTLPLSAQWTSFTPEVCAGHHTDASLPHRMGDEITDTKVLRESQATLPRHKGLFGL